MQVRFGWALRCSENPPFRVRGPGYDVHRIHNMKHELSLLAYEKALITLAWASCYFC